MELKINFSNTEHKDLLSYCNLNDLLISKVVKDSFTTGFNIERYGLLNPAKTGGIDEKQVEIEVIREKRVEIPVEVIKEVIKIEYVEVPVEVIKEVPVEKIVEVIKYVDREVIKEVKIEVPVEKIVYIYDKKEEEVVTNLDNICDKPEPIIIEKIVEVIKEVPVEVVREVVVEKETTDNSWKPKLEALQNTVQKLKQDNIDKDKKIKEYEKTIEDIQKFNNDKKALFLKGSNLDDKLYR